MTMAPGVKSSPNPPSGPCRLIRPYTTRPTTTVGIAIRVLSIVMTQRLSGNSPMAMASPSGMPTSDANRIDQAATLTDVRTAAKTSRSRDRIRESEVWNDSRIKSIALLFPVSEEDRLAVYLVTGNDPQTFRAGDEIDEFHSQIVLHVRMLLRIDDDDAVGIEEPFLPFEEDDKIALFTLEGVIGAAVGHGIPPALGGHRDDRTHSLARLHVPVPLRFDSGTLPEFLLLDMGPRLVTP